MNRSSPKVSQNAKKEPLIDEDSMRYSNMRDEEVPDVNNGDAAVPPVGPGRVRSRKYVKKTHACFHIFWYWTKHILFSLGFLAWAGASLGVLGTLYIIDVLFNSFAWISNYVLLTYLRPISNPERYRKWYQRVRKSAIYWDWSKIDTRKLAFPRDFLWGTSTASHQIEGGCDNNNWSAFERRQVKGEPAIKNGDRVGAACDHWNRVDEDLGLMQELGVNAYRFSLEWSKIEPREGQWDQKAIDHYHREIDLYLANNIVPFVTLHHFTEPLWFVEKDGFEREENIQHFLDFCVKVYTEYGAKVEMWTTINEIEVYVNNGWNLGIFPPGKKDPNLAARVTLNLCRAHVAVYQELKQLSVEHGWPSQIGLVKDIFQFDVLNWWNPLDHYLAWQLNHTFNDCILDFFRTGFFHHWAPFFSNIHYHDANATSCNDFIGLNYYSHYCVSVWRTFFQGVPDEEKLAAMPREIYTDMPHVMYPEGFYRALRELQTLNLPIIVTENGIADKDDSCRQMYIARYMYAMSKAIHNGCDVRGYFYWSLLDNFEWSLGYGPKFGLYEVDFKTQERRLRDGAKIFRKIVQKHRAGDYLLDPEDIEFGASRRSMASALSSDANEPVQEEHLHGMHRRPTL
uniref:Beta-glucosidase n=1 Tax=Heterosigma akashiwo TaxID=2829 RepID=A0A7S4D568_HETAK